jgi:myo-inositol-1(or 4)-monophosphatase
MTKGNQKRNFMQETTLAYRTALKAARKAGGYLLARFHRDDRIVKSSERHDVKLDVDVETEKLIIEAIRRVFPGHGFLGEEGGDMGGSGGPRGSAGPPQSGASPGLSGSGGTSGSADRTWIVDPLDGTVNFAWGIPHFCTSIAFKRGDALVAGAVYDPIRRELFSARRGPNGEGCAFLNEKTIKSPGISDLGDAVVAGGFFKVECLDDGARIFRKLSKKIMKVRFLGSAALDLCYLACGRVNAYIQYSVHEWDIAAALLVAELCGKRYEIEKNRASGTMNVLAADPAIFDELKDVIGARGR